MAMLIKSVKKSMLNVFKLKAKILILVLITIAVSYIMSRSVETNLNKLLEIASIVLMVIGVATVLENYKFGLSMGISGIMVLLISVTILSPSSSQLSMKEKLEDYEYLYKTVSENYPLLKSNERVNGVNWLGKRETFRSNIEKTTNQNMSDEFLDSMFAAEISKIIRELNNNHTHVVGRSFFVNHTVHSSVEYDDNFKLWDDVLKDEKTLKWYNFDDNILDQEPPSPFKGALRSANYFPADHYLASYPASRTKEIAPGEVAYLRIFSMDPNRVEKDGEIIRKYLNEVESYDKLIIDIRGNYGGDDTYWRENVIAPLINEELSVDNYFFVRGGYSKTFYESRGIELYPINDLDKDIIESFPEEVGTDFDYYGMHNITIEPLKPIGFKGEIYILVDSGVYGSAERFAGFAKDSGFATLVGGTTGGNSLAFEPLIFSLPNSGMVIRFRGELALNGDGNISSEIGIIPNIQLDDTTIVYNHELDRLIQYVVNKE